MITRRQIREAVVQLIYSTEFEGSHHSPEAREAFWTLLLEDQVDAIVVAQAKSLIHLTTGRQDRVDHFARKTSPVQESLAAYPETEVLRRALAGLVVDEKKWLTSFSEVSKKLRSTGESEKKQLPILLERLLEHDRALISKRASITRIAEDFPQFLSSLDPVLAALRKLQNLSERAQWLSDTENYSQHHAIAHLEPAIEDFKTLRREAESTASQLAQNQQAIDQHISSLVENYQPDRINPVERCVLRLGVFEILYVDDVPPAVTINEAVEIVRAFSTEQSHRFVNGILDTVAKAHVSPTV